jgi:hypothetical protein
MIVSASGSPPNYTNQSDPSYFSPVTTVTYLGGIFLDPSHGIALILQSKVEKPSFFHLLRSAKAEVVEAVIDGHDHNGLTHVNCRLCQTCRPIIWTETRSGEGLASSGIRRAYFEATTMDPHDNRKLCICRSVLGDLDIDGQAAFRLW